eukprot:scaffold58302_cov72-Phaeocystis_antarctica.AAC.5
MLHGEQTRDTDAERHEYSLNLLQKLCERPHRVEAKSSILSLSMLLLGCVHARGQQAHRAGGETVAREDLHTATANERPPEPAHPSKSSSRAHPSSRFSAGGPTLLKWALWKPLKHRCTNS